MMKERLCTEGRWPRGGARRVLPWLLLALFSVTAWAGGGGGGNNSSGSDPDENNSCSSPEEVTSLPIVEDTSGLTFLGTLRELRSLQISLRGDGRVVVNRIDSTLLAVTLVGDYVVELDRAALASSSVRVLFRGGAPFEGGFAVLQIGSSDPVILAPDRVPLPLSRLAAAPRAQGELLTLDAFGVRARTHVEAYFAPDRVRLIQLAD